MAQSEIQFDTVGRLTALRQIAQDLNEKSRRRAQEARDLAANVGQAKARLADLRAVRPGYTVQPHQPAADHVARRVPLDTEPAAPQHTWAPGDLAGAITAAERRVADLEQAVDRAQFEATDAQGRWQAAARLYDACAKFAKDAGLPLPVAIHEVGPDRFSGVMAHGSFQA